MQYDNYGNQKSSELTTLVIAGLVVFALMYYLYPGLFSHASIPQISTSSQRSQAINANMTTKQMISTEFGSYSQQALRIANCESGMNPQAVNPQAVAGSNATGLFQILYPSTWNTTSYAQDDPKDPVANTEAAFQIFQRDGYSWHEWACAKIVGL
jgi:hypothetical protein